MSHMTVYVVRGDVKIQVVEAVTVCKRPRYHFVNLNQVNIYIDLYCFNMIAYAYERIIVEID